MTACTGCGTHFPRKPSESWKRLCVQCWLKSKGMVSAAAPALDAPRIRQLLQLCHPDRHAGSALANEVTAWLLSLRKAAR